MCGDFHLENLTDNTLDWDNIYSDIAKQLLEDGGLYSDALYNFTADQLSKALSEGLKIDSTNSDKNDLFLALQKNIYKFSAAKTATQMQLYKEAMADDKGVIRSFDSFKKVIADQGEVFNNAYLKTEFNYTKQAAIMAHKWDTLDSEYLEFTTVGDNRVRAEHAIFDKFTAPKSDPIWKRLYTPLAFGCRCTVIPGIEKNVSQEYDSEWANKTVGPLVKGTIFDNNVGISKEVFTKVHPYFEAIKTDNSINPNFKENKVQLIDSLVKGNITINRKELNSPITFTSTGIKEAINQPHEFISEKNNMLLNIDKVLKKAKYLGSKPDYKQNPMVKKIHVFETNIKGVRTFLITRELKTGEIHFYSTSDSEKVIKDIKK